MSDVFISYKREDRERVAHLVEGLKRNGLSVWWDPSIAGGERWRQTILEELEVARYVVVVWTEASIGPDGEFVHEEAARAKARGVLLPVRMDAVVPPLGFGEIQALDLVGWKGRLRDRRFQNVLAAARAIVEGKPRPQPPASPLTPRLAAAWVGGLAAAATAAGLAADLTTLEKWVCRVPGIRGLCANVGLGGLPSAAEEALWRESQSRGCDGLRAYLARHPAGAYAEQAQSRLQTRVLEQAEAWVSETRSLPLTTQRRLAPLPTEAAARAEAVDRSQGEAASLCARFTSDWYRVLGASAVTRDWRCIPRGSGWVCGFSGDAICQLERRQPTEREVCP